MLKEWVSPIQCVLNKRYEGATVRLSAKWMAISDEYGVGVKVGRSQLRLSDRDLDRLSSALSSFLGVKNPLLINFDSDRLTLAKETAQEKLSKSRAFSLIRVASTEGLITVKGSDDLIFHQLYIPKGMILSLSLDKLIIDEFSYKNIIIIENGAAIENWSKIVRLLPDELASDSLFIYRGHGNEQRELLNKLSSLSSVIKIFFFGDYDPSGIDIAINTISKGVAGKDVLIIAPARKKDIVKSMSKPDIFMKQSKVIDRIKNLSGISKDLSNILDHLGENGFAVTQETLIAHRIKLDYYCLKSNE